MSSPMVVDSHGVAPHRLWLEIQSSIILIYTRSLLKYFQMESN